MNLFSVTNVHEPQATESIEYSLTEYLKEGLLSGGAFLNQVSGTLLESPRSGLTARTVYQTPRSQWVWESGVAYGVTPINPSGVYVNGTFRAFGSGVVPNYPAGTVTFSTPLAAGSTVVMNYGARTVQVFNPRSAGWLYQLQLDSYDVNQSGSGTWSPDGRDRVQLPCVFVQALPRVGRFTPRELGSLGRAHRQDVVFDVLAEFPSDRDRLHDALVSQWETRFNGVDLKRVLRANKQGLTSSGGVNPSGLGSYTALATAYPWSQIRIMSVDSTCDPEQDRPRLFRGQVRWVVEADLPFG